jgi:SAM-dependent methyltransferase
MDLKETDTLGVNVATHWYYRSKAEAMLRLIDNFTPSKILDVGAGSGFFSRQLLSRSSAEEAWCVDTNYAHDSDSVEFGKSIHFRRSVDSVSADLVLMMDVLEHVDDDVGLLGHYVQKAPQGSRFLISVPAFQFLWSDHDIFLEHKRRYTLDQLESVVKSANLTVKDGTYYFGLVFPLVAVMRLAQRLRRHRDITPQSQLSSHHPLISSTLAALCHLELPLMGFNRFAGLTAFCLAEKQ